MGHVTPPLAALTIGDDNFAWLEARNVSFDPCIPSTFLLETTVCIAFREYAVMHLHKYPGFVSCFVLGLTLAKFASPPRSGQFWRRPPALATLRRLSSHAGRWGRGIRQACEMQLWGSGLQGAASMETRACRCSAASSNVHLIFYQEHVTNESICYHIRILRPPWCCLCTTYAVRFALAGDSVVREMLTSGRHHLPLLGPGEASALRRSSN